MLEVVKELWFKIDGGRDLVELPAIDVARMLSEVCELS